MRVFINEAPLAISMLDRDMCYLAASKRWLSDYNLEGQDLVGRSHYETFPEIPAVWRDVHKRCLAGATEKADEDLFIREDGSQQWVRWEVKPWKIDQNTALPDGILIFSEDITSRKLAEHAAQAALRMKDKFIATLSHELRNPLHAMLGWIQVLKVGNQDLPKLELAVGAIEYCARAQAQIVSDILDVNRIAQGKLQLNLQEVNLSDLIHDATAATLPEANSKGIGISISIGCIPPIVKVDEARLNQCLWNLIVNALKFTPAGGHVTVSARQTANSVEIAVSDSGRGIEAELLQRIFNRWVQADASTGASQAGLGLGLEIVRKLVELHGGTVRAESPGKDQGSTFTMKLPSYPSGLITKHASSA